MASMDRTKGEKIRDKKKQKWHKSGKKGRDRSNICKGEKIINLKHAFAKRSQILDRNLCLKNLQSCLILSITTCFVKGELKRN